MASPKHRTWVSLAALGGATLVAGGAEAQRAGDPVAGTFICTLVPGPVSVTFEAHQAASEAGGRVIHTYSHIFNGFALRASGNSVARMVERNPRITSCAQSRYVTLPEGASSAAGKPGGGGGKPGSGGGSGGDTIDWGVQRVGGPDLNADGSMKSYSKKAYVVDTGVDLDHPELAVRTDLSRSFLSDPAAGNDSADDFNGHGSHVAGVIGARAGNGGIVGVAPGVSLISVRVLDSGGSAPDIDVLAGLDYILSPDSQSAAGDVVNLSLTADSGSTVLDTAVTSLGDAGLKVVMAAGNSWANVDTANVSPAYLNGPNLFTVSAFKKDDFYSYPSNSGPSVDFAEPGDNIYSLDKNGGYTTKSGTSMAAPHLSGILVVAGSAAPNGTTRRPRGLFVDPDGVYDTIGVRP